jgi:carbamoyl-phosphate synthase large subunit
MGVGRSFGEAFYKSQLGANVALPRGGCAFISVREQDRTAAVDIGKRLRKLGFDVVATRGTARVLRDAGVDCQPVNKVLEGQPHIVDMIKNDEISLIINTTEGKQAIADSFTIRRTALQRKVAYTTTMAGAFATVMALEVEGTGQVNRLQDLHKEPMQQ